MSAGNLGGFDPNAPENNAANVLPKGEYPVAMVRSEVKLNKDGKTQVLHCEFQVLPSHEFANKKIFQQIPFRTTNTDPGKQDWVRIGATKLSSLARALNIPTLNDSSELLNKPCIAMVKVKEASDGYDASNEITKFKPRSTSQGIAPPVAPPVAAPAQSTPGNSPW
ncbi:MAG: DUF669 domain-containing protein [Caulobacteraceae bacterium]|nr:DUF669 domain-containing protein [Caulobacteraceae bacterium]